MCPVRPRRFLPSPGQLATRRRTVMGLAGLALMPGWASAHDTEGTDVIGRPIQVRILPMMTRGVASGIAVFELWPEGDTGQAVLIRRNFYTSSGQSLVGYSTVLYVLGVTADGTLDVQRRMESHDRELVGSARALFEDALAVVSASCRCTTPPFSASEFATRELGTDAEGAEVSIDTCRHCGRDWLRYLVEEPHHSRSGRWWRVAVPASMAPTLRAAQARGYIQLQVDGFVGGSYFDSAGRAITGPIEIF
jgi:hypothetical protein